jgi:hypothetical protein
MSDKLPMFRLATQLVASIGVSKVINDIITNNTRVETAADAVKVWTGSIVIGSMIAEQAVNHVNSRIDQASAWLKSREAENATTELEV